MHAAAASAVHTTDRRDDVVRTVDSATPPSRPSESAAAASADSERSRGPAVEIDSVSHDYGAHRALDAVSLAVGAGEIFALLGPNGSGKTTLFRILATLLVPQAGAVRILGRDVAQARDRVRADLGVVFQAPALDRKLTVRENLRYQAALYGLRGAERERRIDAALERFQVADRRDALVETLSGGLRRRVEIAKAILHRPRVLVLDEPSTGLDPGARLELWRALQEIRARDAVTVLMTSHILEEVERSDRVAILDGGRLVALGSPSELEARVGGDVVTIAAADAPALAAAIAARFAVAPAVVDGAVRIDRGATPDLVRGVLEAFAAEVKAVTWSRPSLEDVFIQCTGRRFQGRDGADADADGAAGGRAPVKPGRRR